MKSRQLTIFILIFLRIQEQEANNNCGKRLINHNALITRGFETKEGDWPWHAAIFHLVNLDPKYMCGGTVLTTNSVLTAAHCLYESGRRVISDKILVDLGKHNVFFGTHTQRFEAHQLIPHPAYNTSNLNNDIAIIRLKTEANFNDYVQPICLPDSSNLDISRKSGIVIGWGKTESDQPSHILREVSMPIVHHTTCLSSNSDFFRKYLTDDNFCAGFQDGASVCNGDSGGSMSFEENGVYYIRGIVSLTSSRKDKGLCNSKDYVVFTNVAQYLAWIEEEVPQPPPPSRPQSPPRHQHRPLPIETDTPQPTRTDLNTLNSNTQDQTPYPNTQNPYTPRSIIGNSYVASSYSTRAPKIRESTCEDAASVSEYLMLYRPGTGKVYVLQNCEGIISPLYSSINGIGGYDLQSGNDRAFAFDYDHSGKMDHIGLYRPATGTMWILKNRNGQFSPVYAQGDTGIGIGGYDLRSIYDRAFAFDYDHSGKMDHIVLYRPGTGTMWILKNQNEKFSAVYAQGDPGIGIGGYDLRSYSDRAFAFDYNHSGKMDHIVLYRPGTGTMWILKNRNGQFSSVYAQGDPGIGIGGYDLRSLNDRAFAFDYDHSGKMDHIVLYRPGTGTMWILKNQNGKFSAVYAQGDPGNGIGGYDLRSYSDRAFVFDYNNIGKKDHITLYRPGTGTIWILKNQNGNFSKVYSQDNPDNGIGGFDLKSHTDRIITFESS